MLYINVNRYNQYTSVKWSCFACVRKCKCIVLQAWEYEIKYIVMFFERKMSNYDEYSDRFHFNRIRSVNEFLPLWNNFSQILPKLITYILFRANLHKYEFSLNKSFKFDKYDGILFSIHFISAKITKSSELICFPYMYTHFVTKWMRTSKWNLLAVKSKCEFNINFQVNFV